MTRGRQERTGIDQEDLAVAPAQDPFKLRRVPLNEVPHPEQLARLLGAFTNLVLVLERPIAVPHRPALAPKLALLGGCGARESERCVARDGEQGSEQFVAYAVHLRDGLIARMR